MNRERRHHVRLPLESRVFIELESPPPGSIVRGRIARCETLEVSDTGLRVRLGEALTVGAILQIGVELPGKGEPFYLVGQVHWRMRDKEQPELWLAGFEVLNAAGSDVDQWHAALQIIDDDTLPPY